MPKVKPTDGPVAVTGGSGYIGSRVVMSMMKRGYEVRACLRDTKNPDKTEFLLALNKADYPGKVELFEANLLNEGSYDEIFKGCCSVLHVGTPMGYFDANTPRQIHYGAIDGTKNVFDSIIKAGSVKRVVFTSSMAAVYHPMKLPYTYTEKDWGDDNQPSWTDDKIDTDKHISYGMAKTATERTVYRIAEEDGRFDVISTCPATVLGPLLSVVHECTNSWQWALGQMIENKPCPRHPFNIWNVVDVRDVAELHALITESDVCKNGDRYISGGDKSGMLDVVQNKTHLDKLFPDIKIGPLPEGTQNIIDKYGGFFQVPIASSDKARKDLGYTNYPIEDTLRETGQTMIDLGLIKPVFK